jgi:pyruvate-ferredoxin/flavodoxin oxidoreductase
VAAVAAPAAAPAQSAGAVATVASESDDALAIDPWIDSARCTTCNECTNLNGKLFMYNPSKQATIKDLDGGPFQHLVVAAERCPVGIIHPGTPRNPKERDLAKWVKRAEPFS